MALYWDFPPERFKYPLEDKYGSMCNFNELRIVILLTVMIVCLVLLVKV